MTPPAGQAESAPPPPDSPELPAPLPESTRRFLRPLLGMDPAEAPIHQGQQARDVAAAAGADALSVGEAVVLGTAQPIDAPETLGLLAHELTHVVRQRQPRYLPPVARPQSEDNAATAAPAHPLAGRDGDSPPDEESLARLVEARVIDAARAAPPVAGRGLASETRLPPPGAVASSRPAESAARFTTTGAGNSRDEEWGGLPAPWDPLPSWLAAPSPRAASANAVATPAAASAPAHLSLHSVSPTALPAGSAAFADGPAAGGPAVQAAEHGRPLETAPDSGPGDAPVHGAEERPEPDLDALSRQVYAILKRRLAAERRRYG